MNGLSVDALMKLMLMLMMADSVMDQFFKTPELVLSMLEQLDVHTFLSFSRTFKVHYCLLKDHGSSLCPSILKNWPSFQSWKWKWVSGMKVLSQAKSMKELSQMHVMHEVGKLELSMLEREEMDDRTTPKAYRMKWEVMGFYHHYSEDGVSCR